MVREITADSPVQYLKTVGPVRARALARLGIETVSQLLVHYPRRYFDRSTVVPIRQAAVGRDVTVLGEVLTSGERRTRRGGSLQTVAIADATGTLFCVWFNQSYLLRQFRAGTRIMCSGVVQSHAGRRQLVHPDFEILAGERDALDTGRLVPQYSLTQGIGQHWLRRLIHATLQALAPQLPETLPASLRARRDLCGRTEALWRIHFPGSHQELEAARQRLIYEEIFSIQLAMALRRRGRRQTRGIQLGPPGDLTRRLVESLPFQLTRAQRRVLAEILADLRSGGVMHRLLQGDVGAGKTLVALIAALFVIEQGYQAVIMAPTEVLAQQHGRTCGDLVAPLGVSVATLTGATPAAERRAILTGLGKGEIDLLVGTHALIQDAVQVPRLALAVVDEQHRFGVLQRGRAARADEDLLSHVLVMSATPIPRSLSLTLYGDLDLSVLDELPAGRVPVATQVVPESEESRVLDEVEGHLAAGHQGYVIYPVIEETEGQDLKAATVEYERLAQGALRNRRLALLHGRLRPREKQAIMADFAGGRLDLLVATTVVEVGLDVPNATVMIIHHPERFGLAQLHQLRGRIGRRAGQTSCCYLLLDRWLPPETLERLRYFATHNDGFALAEEDLRRRGPGDVWGVRQHGAPGFYLANPLRDAAMVKLCATDAEALLAADPQLAAPDHLELRRALQTSFHHLLPLAAAG